MHRRCNNAKTCNGPFTYGGTAGGTITAVAAAGEGLRVALEPERHLGGVVSGGLGWTDHGRKEVIGGISREFFERVRTPLRRSSNLVFRR